MKKILLLFIASSLSLFATIRGYDENDFIKVLQTESEMFQYKELVIFTKLTITLNQIRKAQKVEKKLFLNIH